MFTVYWETHTVHAVVQWLVSDSLQPHGLQHVWPPCPLYTVHAYSTFEAFAVVSLLKIAYIPFTFRASLVAQLVKYLPAMWEPWVRSLGWEDPLEKGKATHSSILSWRIQWTA